MRDTIREKSDVRAHVVLNKKGHHVATVHVRYAKSGGVTVEVLSHGDAVAQRTAEAMGYAFDDDGKVTTFNGKATKRAGEYAYQVAGFQRATAGGWGYDKTTAALSGLYIDGIRMTNHCGERLKRPKGRLWQESDRKRVKAKGYRFANWSQGMEPGELDRYGKPRELNRYGREGVPDTASGYVDAYRLEGLAFLSSQGYRVIQAI